MNQSDVHALAQEIEELAKTKGFKTAQIIYQDNNTRDYHGTREFYCTFQVQLYGESKLKKPWPSVGQSNPQHGSKGQGNAPESALKPSGTGDPSGTENKNDLQSSTDPHKDEGKSGEATDKTGGKQGVSGKRADNKQKGKDKQV